MAKGLDRESLDMFIRSLKEAAHTELTDERLLEIDEQDEFPMEVVRDLFGATLGVQLLFIPEEFDGMGGSAMDIYRVSEAMARIDLGIATGVLATFLGSEPICVGGTPDQQAHWLRRIANEQLLFAYGATEAGAGSDLAALKTTATPVLEGSVLKGYTLNGTKQWISNGGVADAFTILANAPGGPSWFVVDKGTEGFSAGPHEKKHGIRASNTAPLTLENVFVPADRLIGGTEGQGLAQAQSVFGYTRVMVAAFGLGGGVEALDRAIKYSTERIQAGTPLSEKQGYTHKLIVPHMLRLEAARAFIEYTSLRLDAGEANLNTEGAIAKYLATEFGNAAAEASIQALGGYGYTREYMVEKIKRDVRITLIYEGTSEILEMTISRDRWQNHLKSRGQYYHDQARRLEALGRSNPNAGAETAALALHALAEVLEKARVGRLTRYQHVLFRLGELIAFGEAAGIFVEAAIAQTTGNGDGRSNFRFKDGAFLAASRAFAREAALKVAEEGLRLVVGAGGLPDAEVAGFEAALQLHAIHRAQAGYLADLDCCANALYGRAGS